LCAVHHSNHEMQPIVSPYAQQQDRPLGARQVDKEVPHQHPRVVQYIDDLFLFLSKVHGRLEVLVVDQQL
jgi:hypothetical protein